MTSDETERMIDALSKDELIQEIHTGRGSRFQGDNYAYLQTRLAALEEQERAEHRQQDVGHKEENLALAREANQISHKANRLSKIAITVSVGAVLITLATQFKGIRQSLSQILLPRVSSDWRPLVDHSKGKDIEYGESFDVFKWNVPLPAIKKLTGEAKFINDGQSPRNVVRLGYKIAIRVAPLDLSKVPVKDLKEKSVVTYEARFQFVLKDKDGFKLMAVRSKPEYFQSGQTSMFQSLVSEPVPSAVARRTSAIIVSLVKPDKR
jgi:hypothetical protein